MNMVKVLNGSNVLVVTKTLNQHTIQAAASVMHRKSILLLKKGSMFFFSPERPDSKNISL